MDYKYRSGRWPWVLVGTLVVLAVLVGLAWAVWKLPPLLYGDVTKAGPDARLQAASSFRTALVAGLAGLAALGGLFFTNRTYRLTQQGQITERYTKAIEQLGNENLDVRLGGIYALESIAYDSARNRGYREHRTIVEVLGAFVREHGQPATPPGADEANDADGEPTTPSTRYTQPTDVQAGVTVLGRLPRRKDVSRGDLVGAHLEGANLAGAHLEGASLNSAHLENADLADAYLEGASLYFAHLENANLARAHLERANLAGAYLEGASLNSAHLEYANVHDADLKRAFLYDAHLHRTFLASSNLEGADLQGADLQGADLSGARLDGADLQGADLQGADLQGADLGNVEGLTHQQLDQATLDETTQLPTNLRPPTGATPPRPTGEQS